MATPSNCKFIGSHEWVKIEGDTAILGISDHAQDALGDITFVELPAVGKVIVKGKEFGVIESVKAASDLYSPIGGEVIEVNTALSSSPEAVNKDPYGAGWLIKLGKVSGADASDLMDAAAYDAFLKTA